MQAFQCLQNVSKPLILQGVDCRVDGGLGDAHDSSTSLSAATRWARREQITSVRIEPTQS